MSNRMHENTGRRQSESLLMGSSDSIGRSVSSQQENRLEKCSDCEDTENLVETFQNALQEVLDQNEALRRGVAEMQASINQTVESVQVKQKNLEDLEEQLRRVQGVSEIQEEIEGG